MEASYDKFLAREELYCEWAKISRVEIVGADRIRISRARSY